MAFAVEEFGVMPDGEEVYRYTISNDNGVSASFTDLGAIWLTMMVPDREGNMADVLVGYDTVETIMTESGHPGEPIGRCANRISGGKFTLNGKTYELEVNNAGKNNIHSGPDYFRDRLWETVVMETDLGTRVEFTLSSPDGDQGFPGNAEIMVAYTLTPDNCLQLDYHIVSDADTIANMTNHVYFNLGGHDSGSILDQKVWIDADAFTPSDDSGCPNGEILPVKGTPMDFTVMKPIGQDIDADYEQLKRSKGYDHNWALNHAKGELELCAKAEDDKSGRTMEVYTDLPGVQFYTANNFKSSRGKNGVTYGPKEAYCFETQFFPDAINKPQFDSPVLKAGEELLTTTIYKFGVK